MLQALVTGISGEVGHGLIKALSASEEFEVSAADIKNPDEAISGNLKNFFECDVSDSNAVNKIFEKENFDIIFHLASILSTGGEKSPEKAIDVNIKGIINLLEAATSTAIRCKKSAKFIFPSSIAAYGLPSLEEKSKNKRVTEEQFLNPITIYGISKLNGEKLGRYFSENYMLLSDLDRKNLIDFRCVRFPGLLSPDTVPSGGTSDYGSEMIHAAAQGQSYECFVRPDTTIPFMAMADAAGALLSLSNTSKTSLTTRIYNVAGFSVSAKEIENEVKKFFPNFKVSYKINEARQRIVDSWPMDIDDSLAQKNWGWKKKYDFEKTFSEYLVPKIKERYQSK
ncbi:MAG: NAD-dependent epimerase/dehydratase family protein [Candidatus Microgenomates bacterium]|jgi:nucleoside-diphosphate-sugar epimerase